MTAPTEDTLAIVRNEEKLSAHETVCAERYKGIIEGFKRGEKRMQRIEYLVYFLLLAALLGPTGALKAFEALLK